MFAGASCTMDKGAEHNDSLLPASSLWVIVTIGCYSEAFELDGERRRAITVGSCIDADVRLNSAAAGAVECFLVRDGDEIRLVPASAASDLRVGLVNVREPMRLWRRTIVEIAGMAMDVRIREEPPTATDHERPGSLESGPVSAFGEPPPSSTAPAVVSVRVFRRAPLIELERLGLLTKRRPGLVVLSGSIGAAIIALALHLGASFVAHGQGRASTTPSTSVALLSHLKPWCSPSIRECKNGGLLLRQPICGCPLVTPAVATAFWSDLGAIAPSTISALNAKLAEPTAVIPTVAIEVRPVVSGD